VCENVSSQEALHNELLHWFPEALFYPEADIAPVEGAIADPENAAERLAVIHKIADLKARSIIVLNPRQSRRAGTDQGVVQSTRGHRETRCPPGSGWIA
jgi:hypothetical protein